MRLNREESQGVSILSWINMNSSRFGSSSVAYPGSKKERLRVIPKALDHVVPAPHCVSAN